MQCLYCLSELADPQRLSCGHVCCQTDLQEWLLYCGAPEFCCPVCDAQQAPRDVTPHDAAGEEPTGDVALGGMVKAGSRWNEPRLKAAFTNLNKTVSHATLNQASSVKARQIADERLGEALQGLLHVCTELRAHAHRQTSELLRNALISDTFAASMEQAERRMATEIRNKAETFKAQIEAKDMHFNMLLQRAIKLRDYTSRVVSKEVTHQGELGDLVLAMNSCARQLDKAPLHSTITTVVLEPSVDLRVESVGTLMTYDVPLSEYMDGVTLMEMSQKSAQGVAPPPLPPPRPGSSKSLQTPPATSPTEQSAIDVSSIQLQESYNNNMEEEYENFHDVTKQATSPINPAESVSSLASQDLDEVYGNLFKAPSDVGSISDEPVYTDPDKVHSHRAPSRKLWSLSKGKKPGEVNMPLDVIFSSHTLYVADFKNHRIQAVHTANGSVLKTLPPQTLMTSLGIHKNKKKMRINAARLAVPSSDRIVITDPVGRCVRVLWIEKGTELHQWRTPDMQSPHGLDFDITSRFIVTDLFSRQAALHSSSGAPIRSFSCARPDDVTAASPVYVTADHVHRGRYLVTDSANHVVKFYDERGTNLGRCGFLKSGKNDGELRSPHGVCVMAGAGNIAVADTWNNRVCMFDSQGRFIKHLLVKTDELTCPVGLAITPDNKKIAVTSYVETYVGTEKREYSGVFLFKNTET